MQDLTPRCYNAEGLIAEADASGQVTRSYGYAPGSTASTGSAQAFSTNPLWLKAAAMGSQTQSYYYYQNDHLGTPMKLLNQSGVMVWSATYDAFGRATVDAGSTVTNSLRFPGQYEDAESGLHYNWMRYYDPNTGRYVTSDPIGVWGGINMYTYSYGNTLIYVDPYGLFCIDERTKSAISLGVGTAVGAAATGVPLPAALAAGVVTGGITYVTSPIAGGTISGLALGAAAGRSPQAAFVGAIGGFVGGAEGGVVGGVVGGAYQGLADRLPRYTNPNGWNALAGPVSRGVKGGALGALASWATEFLIDRANQMFGDCGCGK